MYFKGQRQYQIDLDSSEIQMFIKHWSVLSEPELNYEEECVSRAKLSGRKTQHN